jgi:hypothetical protein
LLTAAPVARASGFSNIPLLFLIRVYSRNSRLTCFIRVYSAQSAALTAAPVARAGGFSNIPLLFLIRVYSR